MMVSWIWHHLKTFKAGISYFSIKKVGNIETMQGTWNIQVYLERWSDAEITESRERHVSALLLVCLIKLSLVFPDWLYTSFESTALLFNRTTLDSVCIKYPRHWTVQSEQLRAMGRWLWNKEAHYFFTALVCLCIFGYSNLRPKAGSGFFPAGCHIKLVLPFVTVWWWTNALSLLASTAIRQDRPGARGSTELEFLLWNDVLFLKCIMVYCQNGKWMDCCWDVLKGFSFWEFSRLQCKKTSQALVLGHTVNKDSFL